ncbi:MAG: FAD-dependent oxidoreductase, partial [Gammaproteobacteria bacterium]
RDRRWRNMLRKMKTVQTQSVQLWMTRDLQGLGWRCGRVPVNATPEPLDVWMDMSQVLAREDWPGAGAPRSIQYLCGPLPGNYMASPEDEGTVIAKAQEAVRSTAKRWFECHAGALWPNAVRPGTSALDWQLLHDPNGRRGADRLDAQYLRANIDPSDRYVLSVAGSTRYRLRPGGSGCRNLFLAGDWTRTSFNAGCIEAAAMSGVDAAQALSGRPAADGALSVLLARLLVTIVRAPPCAVFTVLRLVRRYVLRFETFRRRARRRKT